MLMKKTIFIVRHGETDGNRHRRFIGSTDLPLNGKGRAQVLSLKPLISSLKFGKCLCSPYLRCRETAQILLEGSQLKPDIDENIREACFGKWEGLTFEEISAAYPDNVRRWAAFDEDFSFPQGEVLRDFLARVKSFASQIDTFQDDKILLVTHGGVIRFLLCHWLRLHPRNHIIFEIPLAALTTVKLYDGMGMLAGLNERAAPASVQS